jgi:Lrp/AsnC family transcriptional regulator for asnA, asnC and gidA
MEYNMKNLTLKDKKILYELDFNARQSNRSIGKKVGFGKDIINRRIKKLVDKGIIKYFYTMIDASKLGYLSCRLFITFQHDPPEKEKEIVDFFMARPDTWWVPSMEGQRNLAIGIMAKDTYEFYDIINEFRKKYKPFIRDFTPGIYVRLHQFRRAYLIDKKVDNSKSIITCFRERIDYDETDISILKILSADARIPTIEIARKLKITSATVRQRINQLIKKNVIQGFRAALDIKKLGYRWYKISIDLEDFTKFQDILSFAKKHPNVVYIYEVVGGWDVEIEVEVENYEKLKSIINEIRDKFSESIRYYETFLFYEEHKIIYMPMTT